MHSLKSGFAKGIPTAIVLSIVFWIFSFAFTQFFRVAGFLESLFDFLGVQHWIWNFFGIRYWVLKPISYVVILIFVWLLGIKSTSGIKWFFTKIFKKKEDRKWLFCVRAKSIMNGYPAGLVSKVFIKNGEVYYNVVYPNLGGMWTFPVPAEDTERAEESVEEVLLTTFSVGFL